MSPHPSEQLTVEGALVESAAEFTEEKLSFLEEFLESLNLPGDALADLGNSALAIVAPLLAALGFDDILPGSGAPDLPAGNPARAGLTNPSSIQQVRVTFGDSDKVCPAVPAGEAPKDLNTVFNEGEEAAGEEAPPTPITDEDGTVWTKEDCPSIIAYVNDLMKALSNPNLTDIEVLELQNKLNFFKNAKTHLKCEGEYPLIDGDTREPK